MGIRSVILLVVPLYCRTFRVGQAVYFSLRLGGLLYVKHGALTDCDSVHGVDKMMTLYVSKHLLASTHWNPLNSFTSRIATSSWLEHVEKSIEQRFGCHLLKHLPYRNNHLVASGAGYFVFSSITHSLEVAWPAVEIRATSQLWSNLPGCGD